MFDSRHDRPRVRALAKPLAEHPTEGTFEKGLGWLLTGITAAAGGDAR